MDSWQFKPIIFLYLTSAIVSLLVALLTNRLSKARGSNYFMLFNLSVAIWTIGYILGLFNTRLPVKLFMLRFEYLGIISAYVFWFLFIAAYTHTNKWLTRKYLTILLIIPVITYIQVLFIDKQNFFYDSYTTEDVNGLIIAKKDFGTGFYIHMAYSYLLSISGVGILVWKVFQMPEKFRNQSIPIVAIGLVFLIPNILYIADLNPFDPYDLTSMAFAVIGILFLLIMYFYRFLDIVPVAYHLVFRNTHSGVIIVDKRGIILDLNTAAEHILDNKGYSFIGTYLSDYFDWFKDIFGQLNEQNEYTREIEIINNNENRFYEINISGMSDQLGILMGWIVMCYDITKRKAALFELDAYARTVAHNLKTPMNAIHGFASLLDSSVPEGSKSKEYSKNVLDVSKKATEIIDSLLLLARVRNYEKVTLEPLDMKTITKKVIKRLDDQISDKQAVVKLSDNWPEVYGQPVLVEEMWVNYVVNALNYGGNPPKIELGYRIEKNILQFYVKDYGEGIDDKEKDSLFQEFSRLKSQNAHSQGYGLGLAIVKRIAKCLGGNVGVESKKGEGCLFYFSLPENSS